MKDSIRDTGASGGSTPGGDSTADYRIRELEARLDRRVAALESQRGRLGWMARLLGLGFVGTLVALAIVLKLTLPDDGGLVTGSLITEEVVLRDGEGIMRGRLGTDPDGRARLSLSDRDGQERIRLTVLADGSPGVTISGADGRPRAVLASLTDGTTNLVFADAHETSRAVFGLEPDGSTHALFTDRSGTIRTLVGVGSDGAPSVSIFERQDDGEASTIP